MTYFTSPEAAHAHLLGVSLATYSAMQMVAEAFYETYGDSEPYLDTEDRRLVDEADVETVTAQDRADLADCIAWEEFMGFHA